MYKRRGRRVNPTARLIANAIRGYGLYSTAGRIMPSFIKKAAFKGVFSRPYAKSENKGGAAPLKSKKVRVSKRPVRVKSNVKLSKDVKLLKKQLYELRACDETIGKFTSRRNISASLLSANNLQNSAIAVNSRISDYESILTNLKYYNPSAPATLVTADGTTGTYQKNFLFKSVYSKLLMRNNYQTDAHVMVYLCEPKADTDQSPAQAWTDGIANDPGNVTASTAYNSYPSDYETFRDFWKAKRVCSKILSPGQTAEATHSIKNVCYDPSFSDSHNLEYQKGLKSFVWLIVVKGTLSHDTSAGEVGIQAAGIDYMQQDTYTVHYDAGVSLTYVDVNNTLGTPTNGFVQSHQPISDNISYSVA